MPAPETRLSQEDIDLLMGQAYVDTYGMPAGMELKDLIEILSKAKLLELSLLLAAGELQFRGLETRTLHRRTVRPTATARQSKMFKLKIDKILFHTRTTPSTNHTDISKRTFLIAQALIDKHPSGVE